MPSKKGMTLEEHRTAAMWMKQAYEAALHLEVVFGKAYGKTKEPSISMKKAAADLLTAKDKADDLWCRENPGPATSPYFGKIDKP